MADIMKNRPIDVLIAVLLVYLFIGLCIVSLQGLSGAKCSPIRMGGDYVYTVNVEAPRFWLLRALKWLPITWANVVDNNVSVSELVSPRECLWVPDGQTPAQAWEKAKPRKPEG